MKSYCTTPGVGFGVGVGGGVGVSKKFDVKVFYVMGKTSFKFSFLIIPFGLPQ